MTEYDVDVAILGAGTAGMAAYREALKYTKCVALIEGGPLGTTCARVGCMPSKLLISAADAAHHVRHAGQFGVQAEAPKIDGMAVMARVRSERDRFVGFVLDAVAGFNEEHLIREYATFQDDHTLKLSGGKTLTAKTVVIATGSRPNVPPPFEVAGDRLIVNDDVFDWDDLPGSVAVFGAGVIGLELGQALHRLGVRTRLFGRDNHVGPISDPDVRDYARDTFGKDFPAVWHADTRIRREDNEVIVAWSDDAGDHEERFDYLIAATGRRPNLDKIGLDNTSLPRDERGTPVFDPLSGQIGDSHVFLAGDATVHLPLLHEAADEGRIAGENAARFPDAFRRARRVPMGVIFSDPQIGMAGKTFAQIEASGVEFEIGEVSYEDQGRARVMGVNKGLFRAYAETETGRLLGMEMIGPRAENLTHLLAWAIDADETVSDILNKPFYHPVLEEGVRTALRKLNHELGFGPNPPLRCIDCGPGA